MRFLTCVTLSALMLLTPTLAHAGNIIEIGKPKKKAKPKEPPPPAPEPEQKREEPKKKQATHYEIRVQMGDDQVSRDLAPIVTKRLQEYGYQLAPSIKFGLSSAKNNSRKDDEENPADVYDNTFSFDIVKGDSTCFVVSKVVGEDPTQPPTWRWETKDSDGYLPCDLQLQRAMKEYAWKFPPIRQAKDFVAIEESFTAAVKKAEEEHAAKVAAAKAAAEAEKARKKAEADEFRARQAEAERQLTGGGDKTAYGKQDGLGCSAASAAASGSSALLALGALPLIRRRRSK